MQMGLTRAVSAHTAATPAISAVPLAARIAPDASPRREQQDDGGESRLGKRRQLAELLSHIEALQHARKLNLQFAELLEASAFLP